MEITDISGRINETLQVVAALVCGQNSIQFNFEYKKCTEPTKMITLRRANRIVHLENLNITEQAVIHWIAFTAFHQVVSAPFVFFDFTNVTKDVVDKIEGLIAAASERSQLFINSSHVHHVQFAHRQIGVHEPVRMIIKMFYRFEVTMSISCILGKLKSYHNNGRW